MFIITKYKNILFFGSFLSIVILISIIIKKISSEHVYNFQSIILALIVYSIFLPIAFKTYGIIYVKHFFLVLFFLIGLFLELVLWFIIFYGIKNLPHSEFFWYLFIPFACYSILFLVLIAIQSYTKKNE